MLKRKYGNRPDWQRVLKREYAQAYIDTEEFKGFITLLHAKKVKEPLFVKYDTRDVCIVDDGYLLLQQFPFNKNHSVTTMFDAKGNIVQWYIDICLENGLDGDIPWMDDLFVDIVILPTGELFRLDDDELFEVLENGKIDVSHYDLANKEASDIIGLVKNNNFRLLHLSVSHKDCLKNNLR